MVPHRTCSLPRVARPVVHRRRVQIVHGQEIVHLRVGGRESVREVTTLSLQVGVAVGHNNAVSTNSQTRIIPARGAVSAFQLLTFVGQVRRFDCQALGVAGGRENFHVDADHHVAIPVSPVTSDVSTVRIVRQYRDCVSFAHQNATISGDVLRNVCVSAVEANL